jgi:hypothetical protein
MDSEKAHESRTGSSEDGTRSQSRVSVPTKALCGIGLVGVLISAICLAPDGPFAGPDVCGVALVHIFLATLCLSILLLNNSGPNIAANHGGIGLLVGLIISFIFDARLKAGMITFLMGAFPGALFGFVIGVFRDLNTETHTEVADVSATERHEHPVKGDGPAE